MERDRLEREREKTEEEVVAHFKRWAENQQVHDWICQAWVSPEERDRRLRAILGLPAEPAEELAPDMAGSNPVKPSQTESGPACSSGAGAEASASFSSTSSPLVSSLPDA
jgi:hypothetical protein